MQALIDFFGIKNLIPHGFCLSWSPLLLWLNVISDLLITLAYYSIPITILYFLRKRKDFPYSWLTVMFAAFIIACGTTHLMSAITIWIPLYWVDGWIKAFTAILSILTSILMLWVVPKALSLPSTGELQAEIEQRKLTEEALHLVNAKLQENMMRTQLLFDSALDGIINMDQNGIVIAWNKQAERIFGYSSEQALGQNLAELIIPINSRENHYQGLSRFVATGLSHIIGTRLEVIGLHAKGFEFPMELAVNALNEKDHYIFCAFVRDITERKKAEMAKQEAFERLRKIASQLPGVVFQFCLHPDGRYSLPYVSDVLQDIYRIDPMEVHEDAAKIFSIVHPDDLENHLTSIQESARDLSLWRNEYRLKFEDGSECWLFGTALPQREADGSVLWHGFVTDITDRKKTEEALKASEEKFRSIIEVSPIPMAMNDEQLNITFVNLAFVQTFGYHLDDIPNLADWWPKAYPDPVYREWVQTTWLTTLETAKREQTDFPPMEVTIRCKDNSTKIVLATAVTIKHSFEGINLAILYDITQRKQMEIELSRSNAELEQFAYAVSHDMRQPLRMVSSYLSLIENALEGSLNEDTRQCLDFAINGAKRMDAMILSLLDYSRVERKTDLKKQIGFKMCLDEALDFLNPEIKASKAEINVTGDWPNLFASADELTRLMQNLIGNALKYHEENKAPQVQIHGTISNSSFRVEVRDQGIGIDASQKDRLFKVFSRLQSHSRFEGNGVGLALCRKIIEHHGGNIGVESLGEGQGSVFWFELPLEKTTLT